MSYLCLEVDLPEVRADEAAELLLASGATGIETRDSDTMVAVNVGRALVIGWFDSRELAEAATRRLAEALDEPSLAAAVQEVEDPGWREAWREYFRPTRFGRRLWVTPPDEDPPTEELASVELPVVLRLLPSVAFGTGTHETTAMMLELLEELVQPGEMVLDVGCGSGVLSMAAVGLGAARARGIDIDPEAVAAAQENAETNGYGLKCSMDNASLESLIDRYDMVLANLSAPVLLTTTVTLADRVRPGGLMLWSGLLESDLDEVSAPPGYDLVRNLRRNGWVAQALRRPTPAKR